MILTNPDRIFQVNSYTLPLPNHDGSIINKIIDPLSRKYGTSAH